MSNCIRNMIGWPLLAAIALAAAAPDSRAAPQDTQFSVQFYGAAKDQILVKVKTADFKGTIVRANFSVAFFDADQKILKRYQYRFVDANLGPLTSGGLYKRVYSHQAKSPVTLKASALSITVQPPGGAADGPDEPSIEAAVAPSTFASPGTPIAYAEETNSDRCWKYAGSAIRQVEASTTNHCNLSGSRWHHRVRVHYDWCMDVEKSEADFETRKRADLLNGCRNHLDAVSTVGTRN